MVIQSLTKHTKSILLAGLLGVTLFQLSGCATAKHECQCNPPKAVIGVK